MSEEPRHFYATQDELAVMNNTVDRPTHYNKGKIEVIDFIEDQKLGFHLGNVIKYIARAGLKDTKTYLEDLQKAKWYLDRYITLVSKLNNREY